MLWPTDYNPFTFLSRNHQHFALTGYIALIACHRRLSTLHRRRQSNTASSTSQPSYRFQLTMDTLAFGYVISTIRAYSGLAPVIQCSCRAYEKDNGTLELSSQGTLFINT